MHPAGILHFASPDFIAVLVIMRKNYKKDSSESVLPGHVRFGQAKTRWKPRTRMFTRLSKMDQLQ